jgi:tRNA (guanine-N7-)-methyltransferase
MSTPTPYDDAPVLPESGPMEHRSRFDHRHERQELEIGPGRGGFVFERLASEPRACVVGLEIRRKWAAIVDARLAARGLAGRARIFSADVRDVLPRVPDASVDAIFVHFPDPWWKKRHRKRLVVTSDFAREAARVLASGGELFIQTDVAERAEHYRTVVGAEPRLSPVGTAPYLSDNPYGARSPRERRAEADGLPVYRLAFRCLGGRP